MLFLLHHADERDFSHFQNVETGSAVQMGTGELQGIKRPGRDPDFSPAPSAVEGTIPLLPHMLSLLSKYSFTFLLAVN